MARRAVQRRRHFIEWYSAHAGPWLRRRVAAWSSRIGGQPKTLEVRDCAFRWGSCGRAGGLNFHWATILLPASVVEYIIVHEMIHLREHHHTPEFWLRVERALPDYERRKEWIAQHGMEFATF